MKEDWRLGQKVKTIQRLDLDEDTDPYTVEWRGGLLDPYRIADLYGLGPALAQALKKLLRMGRKHKSAKQDAEEVASTLARYAEMKEEDESWK